MQNVIDKFKDRYEELATDPSGQILRPKGRSLRLS